MREKKRRGIAVTIIAFITASATYILLSKGIFSAFPGSFFFIFSGLTGILTLISLQLAVTWLFRNAFQNPVYRFYGNLAYFGSVGTLFAVLADNLLFCTSCAAFDLFISAAVFFLILLLGSIWCLLNIDFGA